MPKPKHREGALSAIAIHEWERSLAVGDFVTLVNEIPHIYVVKDLQRRIILAHDLFNNPSIAVRGLKEGDEIPPLLQVQRVREAPSYALLPLGRTFAYKVDAYKVTKITFEDVQFVVSNLLALGREIQERNQDADSLPKG